MIKLKPSNIFDHYSPTGNSCKIADFGIQQEIIKTEAMAPTMITGAVAPQVLTGAIAPQIPAGTSIDLPGIEQKDNILGYVVIAAIIITGIIIYVKIKNDAADEKRGYKKTNLNPKLSKHNLDRFIT